MLRFLMVWALTFSIALSKENVSLSKILFQFQGSEYNVLVSPKQVVIAGKKKKTRKAVSKGFKRAVLELVRQVKLHKIDFNLKIFTPKGSNLRQYKKQDTRSYYLLKNMLEQQVTIREAIFSEDEINQHSKVKVENINTKVDADDIDIDLDDSAFDISEELVGEVGSMKNVSPSEAFVQNFIEIGEQYNQEIIKLTDVVHPFNVAGKPEMHNINSVFGMAFFPSKYGSIKMIKVYVVLANLNTEKAKSAQIIVKEINPFRWDRNYIFISAETGKVLRQIISSVLGEPFLAVN